jgi:hypothetical protein
VGYRSDLDAAQARAAALEKQLASGRDENEALRQKIEELQKPAKKPKPPKKPKKKRVLGQKSGLRALLKPGNLFRILSFLSILALLGTAVFAYRSLSARSDEIDERLKKRAEVGTAFIAAWAEKRYEDAWDLTDPEYQREVGKERFLKELANHPFLRGLSGGHFANHWEGVLQTQEGEIGIRMNAHNGSIQSMWTFEGFGLLPPRAPAVARSHAFVAALLARNFEEAWSHTHPIYRKSVAPAAFAQRLEQDIWIREATGFRLKAPGEDGPANVLQGFLMTDEGSVGLTINYSKGKDAYWVSEMSISGKPTLPTP